MLMCPARPRADGQYFRGKGCRHVRHLDAEPFVLQCEQLAVATLLGEELVDQRQELRVPLLDRPGRISWRSDRLADGEHVRLLLCDRVEVDQRVDDEVDAPNREVLIGLRIGGVLHHFAEIPTHAFQLGLELRPEISPAAANMVISNTRRHKASPVVVVL